MLACLPCLLFLLGKRKTKYVRTESQRERHSPTRLKLVLNSCQPFRPDQTRPEENPSIHRTRVKMIPFCIVSRLVASVVAFETPSSNHKKMPTQAVLLLTSDSQSSTAQRILPLLPFGSGRNPTCTGLRTVGLRFS